MTRDRGSRPAAHALKRSIDLVGSATGLVVGALPMAVVAVAVRRNLGRPVFFRQVRPGLDGHPFTLVKFRTMRDGEGSDAERLTPFGSWLRATSIASVTMSRARIPAARCGPWVFAGRPVPSAGASSSTR